MSSLGIQMVKINRVLKLRVILCGHLMVIFALTGNHIIRNNINHIRDSSLNNDRIFVIWEWSERPVTF